MKRIATTTATIAIATAAGLMLYSFDAQAGPAGTQRLTAHDHGQPRQHHRAYRHQGAEYAQHRYDNARRYAANAVRHAREIRYLGYYPDHPRWSTSFQQHFDWALKVDSRKLERQTRKRARKLRELRQRAQYRYRQPH